jgi:uncharacterized membrane protein YeaQ/YmgE (transglycosylase-associated protein family)
MELSFADVIGWLILGAVAGSLAGLIIARKREGFGAFRNLLLGVVGAVIGGLVFELLGVLQDTDAVTISLGDLVGAVIGSLLVLLALRLVRKRKVG